MDRHTLHIAPIIPSSVAVFSFIVLLNNILLIFKALCDLIVLRQQNCAENGDIVVALVDGKNTLKRFYKKE